MSGKEPPRAPRALLHTFSTAAASSASATASNASPPVGPSRIGGVPPTGPRSLVNGHSHLVHPSLRVAKGKLYANGHITIPTGPATIAPPTGPSARFSHKGKQVEDAWTTQNGLDGSFNASEAGPSSRPVAPVQPPASTEIGGLTARTQAISFKLRPTAQPAPPKLEPQPPPQPTSEPPPPPPPTSEPPPPPPPPPLSEPPSPPPPPLSEQPPPPPPPSVEPPPTPPPPIYPPPPPPPPSLDQPPPPPSPVTGDLSRSHSIWVPPPPSEPIPSSAPQSPAPQLETRPAEPISKPHPLPDSSETPKPAPPPDRPKVYSLPPPPPWPPASSEYPPGKDYKVLYDHALDKDRDGQFRMLIEKLRQLGADQGEEARLKGKGKGKEILLRYNGEVIPGEHEAVIRDPRKDAKAKRSTNMRPPRSEFVEVKYEHDANSIGPPPPTSVLVMGLSPLASSQNIRRYFTAHGTISSFEPQIDKVNGGALGIVLIGFSSHEEAKRCVAKEHGKKPTPATGLVAPGAEVEEIKVVFDGEGKKLSAVLKKLDERKRQEREERRRREKMKESSAATRGTPSTTAGQTPQSWKGGQPTPSDRQQSNGFRPPAGSHRSLPSDSRLPPKPQQNGTPKHAPIPRQPPMSLVKARLASARPVLTDVTPHSHDSSSTPVHSRGRYTWRSSEGRSTRTLSPSRSPSPVLRKPGESSRNARQKEHEAVVEALAKNGFDYVTIDSHGAQLSGAVTEDDVKQFFDGFKVDRVLKDYSGWYVTFQTADSARRAALVLSSGARTLSHHSVTVTAHTAPARSTAPSQTHWDDKSLAEEAQKIILRDLRALLEKDVTERIVATSVRRMVVDEKANRSSKSTLRTEERIGPVQTAEAKSKERLALKGLSFRKQKRSREQEVKTDVPSLTLKAREDSEAPERPKKRTKIVAEKVIRDDIESEDEEDDVTTPTLSVVEEISAKRATSELSDDEPAKKRLRTKDDDLLLKTQAKKSKKAPKKSAKAQRFQSIDDVIHEILPDDYDFDKPSVTKVRFTPDYESSLSPPSSPVLAAQKSVEVVPPPDPFAEGLCDDDEDLYFAKLALSRDLSIPLPAPPRAPSPDPTAPPPFRVHITGAARSEGYYKISHAEKSAYVAQYASRTAVMDVPQKTESKPQPTVTSSRSNRANARRRVQGLEEINQVQLAMALSKGESATTELVKFNQLQTRKKQLRFAQSPIHAWGLYAMEKISRGEMVIEYVGEIIRAQVADKREKAYERSGIGSSYLFRIDDHLVVDATKIGNLGRLINHSCDPNCTAKIITINGEKKIVIYAKQDIELGSEITYDYHFPIEQDKIPCLCGSEKCRGYLN